MRPIARCLCVRELVVSIVGWWWPGEEHCWVAVPLSLAVSLAGCGDLLIFLAYSWEQQGERVREIYCTPALIFSLHGPEEFITTHFDTTHHIHLQLGLARTWQLINFVWIIVLRSLPFLLKIRSTLITGVLKNRETCAFFKLNVLALLIAIITAINWHQIHYVLCHTNNFLNFKIIFCFFKKKRLFFTFMLKN